MQSTFSGIEIGKRSLIAHNRGLTTVGHNMSNASVEGYSRQRIEMVPFEPIYMPGLNRAETAGQLGQGVIAERIERIHDQILEGRIVSQANGQGYWDVRSKYLTYAEDVYLEPGENSFRNLLDNFWISWENLSQNPEEMAVREEVLQRGQALVDGMHRQYQGLKEIRDMLDQEVNASVTQINTLLSGISSLNEQIIKIKAMGDNPNDLLDRRDLLVKELSGIIDITVDNRDPDEFLIHTGGLHLIQGKIIHYLTTQADPQNEGYSQVMWVRTGDEARFSGGKLAGFLELRDRDIREEIQKLDVMAINFMDMVNEHHRAAYGLNGKTGIDFFREYPFVNNLAGDYDRDGDGQYDSTYIFRINGTNTLNPKEQIGLEGVMTLASRGGNIEIPYYSTDTVDDVIYRINLSGSEVVASLDREGRLSLKGTSADALTNPDFVIRHAEDSGQFLVGYAGILQASGAEGAYDWTQAGAVNVLRGNENNYAVAPLTHPAGWMVINPELRSDLSTLAAGFGVNGRPAEPGDGSAALAIASLRVKDVMIGRTPAFDDYFSHLVAEIGLKGQTADKALHTENLIMKDLTDMKDSISGVNIDEELAQMIKFQHGYTAAARFINVVNDMLDVIINRLGV